MPILANLSRRFHLLTTDAKPDPPRVAVEGYTHNLDPPVDDIDKNKDKKTPKSAASAPEINPFPYQVPAIIRRQTSAPAGESNGCDPGKEDEPEEIPNFSRADSEQSYSPPRFGAKPRFRSRKSQNSKIVNYNIVNSNGVKIGDSTKYVLNVGSGKGQSEESRDKSCDVKPMPDAVEALSHSTEEIELDDMLLLKNHLGHGWRDVARRLGYSDGQVEQFEENYSSKGIDEVIYRVLLDWKRANTKDAQIGHLVSIIWSCREYSCVKRLALMRKIS